jgi:hypothetical protein
MTKNYIIRKPWHAKHTDSEVMADEGRTGDLAGQLIVLKADVGLKIRKSSRFFLLLLSVIRS